MTKTTSENGTITPGAEKKALNLPSSTYEVRRAIRLLKTNKSCGPDNVSNELIKSAGPKYIEIFTKIINEAFENGQDISSLGKGFLNPIPKPGKERGPTKNLRPIILLNSARKSFP